jgi:nucleoside-diphosphate-sugar epimerase
MKLFVTGATGFIGSHFINAASSAGHDILALRRPGSLPSISVNDSVQWVDGFLADVDTTILSGCEVLVHLAAAGIIQKEADWVHCYQVNVMDSLQLWLRAADSGIGRFIIAGSCFEYGSSGEVCERIPFDAPLVPTGPYHASKASASLAAIGLSAQRKLKIQILRPFHVYGEGEMEERFWPSLKKAALSGEDFPMTTGDQIRDFTPVGLVAAKFLEAALNADVPSGQAIIKNIGTGNSQTLREFAESWWLHWNAKGKLLFGAIPQREGETMRYVPQI